MRSFPVLAALLLCSCARTDDAWALRVADAGSKTRVAHPIEPLTGRKKCNRDSDCPEHYACACPESDECTFKAVIGEAPGAIGENVCEWLPDDEELPPGVVEWRRQRDAGLFEKNRK
jgi:hypothetical protein